MIGHRPMTRALALSAAAVCLFSCAPPPPVATPPDPKVRRCMPIYLDSDRSDGCIAEVIYDEATRLGYLIYNHGHYYEFPDAQLPYGLRVFETTECGDAGSGDRIVLRAEMVAPGGGWHRFPRRAVVPLPWHAEPTREVLRELFVALVESREVVAARTDWDTCADASALVPPPPEVAKACRYSVTLAPCAQKRRP